MTVLYFVISVIVIIAIGVIVYDSNRFVLTEYDIESDKLTGSVKAVFVSDLHNKKYKNNNEELFLAIEKEKPDVILCGGDIITAKPGLSTEYASEFMRRLSLIAPVVYAKGNHEYRSGIYPEVYGDMYKNYEEALGKIGLSFLDNGCKEFNGLNIYGLTIDRDYYRRFKKIYMDPCYINSILGTCDKDRFNLVLAHNPEYFESYSEWGADLVLSGHVHGGIVRLPFVGGVVSPKCILFPKYDGGMYEKGKAKMIVSRGLGMHTIPIRMFNPGELVVINFKGIEKSN